MLAILWKERGIVAYELENISKQLSLIARENRAEPKDRVRPISPSSLWFDTFAKRLRSVTFITFGN